MLVSIVTVYYNRENQVKKSIESLLNQTYQNIEIIAVDDGSTDNTFKLLSSYEDSRLKVIRHTNCGFVKSIRKAIDHANGEIIAVHGSGDISFSKRVEKQVNVLKENSDIGVVSCYCETQNLTTNQTHLHKPKIDVKKSLTNQLLSSNLFTHGEVMYRKSLYEKVEGYREFFKFTQDYDLWLRMSVHSSFHIVEEVLYRRYVLNDGVSGSLEKQTLQRYFGEMARQGIENKLKGEKDLIDQHGYYAPFYRNRSLRLSNDLFKLSVFAMSTNDLEQAIKINNFSINEKRTLKNNLWFLILFISNKSNKISNLISSLCFNTIQKIRNASSIK